MTAGLQENTYGIVKRLEVIRDWLKRASPSAKPVNVLDYGCGTGDHITYPLALDGYDVLGVDLHAPSIHAAETRYRLTNLVFRTLSIDGLVEEGLTFDAIICSEVLEHLENPLELLRKMKRLLRRNGLLIVTVPNGYGSYEFLCSLERILQKTGIHGAFRAVMKSKAAGNGSDAGFLNHESGHIQFFGLRTLQAMFESAGFRITERRGRTLICGPYADIVLNVIPFRKTVFRWNAAAADILPLRCAADWMFLLQPNT